MKKNYFNKIDLLHFNRFVLFALGATPELPGSTESAPENEEIEEKIEEPKKIVTPEMQTRNSARQMIINYTNKLENTINNKTAQNLRAALFNAGKEMSDLDIKAGDYNKNPQERTTLYKQAENIYNQTVAPLIKEVTEFLKNPNELQQACEDQVKLILDDSKNTYSSSSTSSTAVAYTLKSNIDQYLKIQSFSKYAEFSFDSPVEIGDLKYVVKINVKNGKLTSTINKPEDNHTPVEISTATPPDVADIIDNNQNQQSETQPNITESQDKSTEVNELKQKIDQKINAAINHFKGIPVEQRHTGALYKTLNDFLNRGLISAELSDEEKKNFISLKYFEKKIQDGFNLYYVKFYFEKNGFDIYIYQRENTSPSTELKELKGKIDQRINDAISHFNGEPFKNKTEKTFRTTLSNYLDINNLFTEQEKSQFNNFNHYFSGSLNFYRPYLKGKKELMIYEAQEKGTSTPYIIYFNHDGTFSLKTNPKETKKDVGPIRLSRNFYGYT